MPYIGQRLSVCMALPQTAGSNSKAGGLAYMAL